LEGDCEHLRWGCLCPLQQFILPVISIAKAGGKAGCNDGAPEVGLGERTPVRSLRKEQSESQGKWPRDIIAVPVRQRTHINKTRIEINTWWGQPAKRRDYTHYCRIDAFSQLTIADQLQWYSFK
jgi:hypothetical protein